MFRLVKQAQTLTRTYSTTAEAVRKSLTGITTYGTRRTVTLIPGDGTGPELAASVKTVFNALHVPVDFEEVDLTCSGDVDAKLNAAIVAVKRNGVALKGHLETGVGFGSRQSLNLTLRKSLGLFANVVACKTIAGVPARHNDVDLIVIRQNTEGEYSNEEHEILPGVVESLKVTTRDKCIEIAKFAFDYAVRNNRSKVTCVHKANIMKRGDGLFLEVCKEVAALYPKIAFVPLIVDNTSMQLVSKPKQFDVLVTPNLYGNIVENIAAGLVGGPGIIPGIDIGNKYAIFEPGTRSNQADESGKNTVNPAAMLLSAGLLLDHIEFQAHGNLIKRAVYQAIAHGTKTSDIGGKATTTEFTEAVIREAIALSK